MHALVDCSYVVVDKWRNVMIIIANFEEICKFLIFSLQLCAHREHIRRGEILSTDYGNGFHGFCSPNPFNLFQKSADSNPFNSNMLLTSTFLVTIITIELTELKAVTHASRSVY